MENNQQLLPQQANIDEDNIDLIQLAKTVWNGRKTVIKTTLIFMGIGLFIAILSPKEYTASSTFVPQTSESKIGGSLGGLAAMAGINIGGMSNNTGISPNLYPQIVSSIPFQKELLQTPLTIEGQNNPITFTEYYTNIYSPDVLSYIKKYTVGLPWLLLKALKGKPENVILNGIEGNHLITITYEENELMKQLSDQLTLDVEDIDGYVSLRTTMPEAIASAELSKHAQELLQRYLIDFNIQKSSEQLDFIKKRYLEVENKFKDAQLKLASHKDRNQRINTEQGKIKLKILQDEYNLLYGVYSELAKQLEGQYIQVTEDTPVFTIIKPVSVPIEKSKPNRLLILFIFTFLGCLGGMGMVFWKVFFGRLKEKLISE